MGPGSELARVETSSVYRWILRSPFWRAENQFAEKKKAEREKNEKKKNVCSALGDRREQKTVCINQNINITESVTRINAVERSETNEWTSSCEHSVVKLLLKI